MLRPGKDQIDIGREVQLAAAQLFPSRGSAAAAADPRRCMAFPTLYSRRRTASRGRRQSGSPPGRSAAAASLLRAPATAPAPEAMRTIIWRRKRRSSRINPASSVTACRRSCSRGFVMPPLFRRRRGSPQAHSASPAERSHSVRQNR